MSKNILNLQKKKGLGNAYLEGLSSTEDDYIITFSPDGNSDPNILKEVVNKINSIENVDILICSRYLSWAKSYDDTIITGIGNWIFTKTFNILYNQKITDYLVLYRAFKRSIVYELKRKFYKLISYYLMRRKKGKML